MQVVTNPTPMLRRHGATIRPALANFDVLPDSALVDDKTFAGVLGCSRNTIWRRARTEEGSFPKPIKVGPKTTRWQVGAIRGYLAGIANGEAA
jgi:predicted DNA-binding transcriptional regulator AlpA